MEPTKHQHASPKKTYILACSGAIVAFLCFSLMDSIIRHLGNKLPTIYFSLNQRLLICLIMFIVMACSSIKDKSIAIFMVRHPMSHIIRGVFLYIVNIMLVRTFTLLPLSNAYSILFSLPLFTTLFARIWIKEKLDRVQLLGIIGGLIGIVIILQPGATHFSVGYLFALAGIIIQALMFVMIRHYHKQDHPLNVTFYSCIIAFFLFYLTELIYNTGASVTLDNTTFIFLLLFAIISVSNQYLLNFSLKHLKAGLSASMQFSQIIWGAVFGYLFFGDNEYTLLYFIGTAIVLFFSAIVTTKRIPFVKRKKIQ